MWPPRLNSVVDLVSMGRLYRGLLDLLKPGANVSFVFTPRRLLSVRASRFVLSIPDTCRAISAFVTQVV